MTTKTRPGVTFKDALTQVPANPRPQCRVLRSNGERCTGEALDRDPMAIQVCTRHAAEVMRLINERTTR